MLEPVMHRTTAKLAASGVLDASEIACLMEALAAGRLRSIAELSALLEEPVDLAEGGRADEDQLTDHH